MDDAEDGAVRADAERERRDGDDGEDRCAREVADGEPQVGDYRFPAHHAPPALTFIVAIPWPGLRFGQAAAALSQARANRVHDQKQRKAGRARESAGAGGGHAGVEDALELAAEFLAEPARVGAKRKAMQAACHRFVPGSSRCERAAAT